MTTENQTFFADPVTQGYTDNYSPIDLEKGTETADFISSASFLAVGGEYRVYGVPHSDEIAGYWTEYVVIWWPLSGPLEFVMKILNSEGRFPNFVRTDPNDKVGDWRAMEAAHFYAMRKASDEVLSELLS